jgi:uncharacterized surface anchored protein
LSPGENDLTHDLGISPKPASLGNYVWYDTDKDGQQDVAETGVAGVIVNLYNAAGTLIKTDTTDASGHYLFTNLNPGDYHVAFVLTSLPANFAITGQNIGNDATDSDVNTLGVSAVTTLSAGENDLTHDMGISPIPASLGNYVWYDTDGDGQQDGTETGVAGVIVHLLNNLGVVIASDTTDANGLYLFPNLNPGTYAVQFRMLTLLV